MVFIPFLYFFDKRLLSWFASYENKNNFDKLQSHHRMWPMKIAIVLWECQFAILYKQFALLS